LIVISHRLAALKISSFSASSISFRPPPGRRSGSPATRYDKLARNFLSAVHLAAAIAFWL
jgi:hypothetical protein